MTQLFDITNSQEEPKQFQTTQANQEQESMCVFVPGIHLQESFIVTCVINKQQ